MLYTQKLITEINDFDKLKIEFNAILSNKVSEALFYTPYVEKIPGKKYINVLKTLDYKQYLELEPVFAIRISNHGMGMYTSCLMTLFFY